MSQKQLAVIYCRVSSPRQVKEGDDPRAGRWAGLEKTECGIHLDGNAIKSLDSSHL